MGYIERAIQHVDTEEIWFAILVLEHDDERKNDGIIVHIDTKKAASIAAFFVSIIKINDRAFLVCVHVRVKVRQQKLHVPPLLFLRNEDRVLQADD